MNTLSIRQGDACAFVATLTDGQGNPITTYTGSETLSASLWPGGNLAAAITPTATWMSPAAGTLKVVISAAQTTTLAEGRWFGTVGLLDGAYGLLEALKFALDVLPAPGSATVGLCYVAMPDLLKHGRGWLRSLQDDDSTEGFVDECADASRWLDDLIIARYPTNNAVILGDSGYGSLSYGVNPGMVPSQWLRGVLAAAGGLILRPKVIEAVSKRALSIIAKGQIGMGKEDDKFRLLGRILETESSGIAMTLVAEICTNNPPNGVPSFGVPLGGTSMRPFLS